MPVGYLCGLRGSTAGQKGPVNEREERAPNSQIFVRVSNLKGRSNQFRSGTHETGDFRLSLLGAEPHEGAGPGELQGAYTCQVAQGTSLICSIHPGHGGLEYRGPREGEGQLPDLFLGQWSPGQAHVQEGYECPYAWSYPYQCPLSREPHHVSPGSMFRATRRLLPGQSTGVSAAFKGVVGVIVQRGV